MVDLVITGSDRTMLNGDVVNKIGTYLKALAARDNDIPFYVAVPSSSIDFSHAGPLTEIPIEERDPDEIRFMEGEAGEQVQRIRIIPECHPVVNYGFDITPSRLVTGLITERGICPADAKGLQALFPERTYATSAGNNQ
jgi:methylthioribose-1-phosphate isomerase